MERHTIAAKLAFMLVGISAITLLLASVGFAIVQNSSVYHQEREEASALTSLMAIAVQAPMLEHNFHQADVVLQSLRAHEHVISAILMDAHGGTIATYRRADPAASADRLNEIAIELISTEADVMDQGQKLGTVRLAFDERDYRGALEESFFWMGITSLLVLLVAVGLAFVMRRAITQPVEALSKGVRRVRESSDYSIRLNQKGGGEFGELAESFNMMLSQLQIRDQRLAEQQGYLESEVERRTHQIKTHLRKLEKTEGNLNKIIKAMERAGEAVMIVNAEGRADYLNPAFTTITGYRLRELQAADEPALIATGLVSPDMFATVQEKAQFGDVWEGEVNAKRKSGEVYPALLSLAAILDNGRNATHYVAIMREISDRMHLEEQLRQAQKMGAIGVLVGGIAHDFNNLLAGIIGNLELAKQDKHDIEKLERWLDDIDSISHRAAETIAKLLAFARRNRTEMQPLSVKVFIDELKSLAAVAIPRTVDLSFDAVGDDVWVSGDGVQLQQVLLNLLNNAVDAQKPDSDETPRIEVGIDTVEPNASLTTHYPQLSDKKLVRISVKDNGSGFDEETRAKLFEPFFTTKEVGKGTGLGLSMAYGIISRHGGVMEAESEPGKGSEFRIYLPKIRSEAQPVKPVVRKQLPAGKGELVLIADDEELVREMGVSLLKRLGYRVLSASDGAEAVELFREHEQEIVLAILDLVMPRMGGAVAAKHMQEMRPELPLLFVTGYDLNSSMASIGDLSRAKVLTKPYRIEEFSQTIRELLGETASEA